MNRITKKLLSILFAVMLLLGVFPISSAAAEDVLFTLDDTRNMAITVAYKKDPPSVSFIAPNGDKYGSAAIADGRMEFYDSGSVLYYRIPNAAPGEWKIVYNKKNNDVIEVDCAPYVEAMNIDSFTYSKSSAEEINTKFKVSYAKSTDYYNYIIWAAVTENGSIVGKTKLCEGSAQLGQVNETTVSLGSLSTYSEYKLMLEVYMESYGVEVFDTLTAEKSFSYTNSNAPEAIKDFKVEVGVTDNYIRLDWTDYAVYCDSYAVIIRAAGKDEPVYAAELSSSETSTEVLVDLSVSSVTCEIAYNNSGGVISKYAKKKIDLSHAKMLSFVCDEVTSASEGKVEYDFTSLKKPIRTIISVNDSVEEALPEGKGSFSVKLKEYDNDVKITWFETDTLSYTVKKAVYSDRKAPLLKLYEMTGKVITEESSYILTGATDPGCTVTVGDIKATVDENGLFTVTLKLLDGVNDFTVTATSKTGNNTKQVISIEKPSALVVDGKSTPLLSYLPLILSFLLATIISIFVFLNAKYYSKKKDKVGKTRAINASIRNVFILLGSLTLICAVFFTVMTIKYSSDLNSSDFINTAYNSVTKAYELIELRNTWRFWMIIAYIAFVVSTLLAVGFGFLSSEKHAQAVKRSKEKAVPQYQVVTQTVIPPVAPVTPPVAPADPQPEIPPVTPPVEPTSEQSVTPPTTSPVTPDDATPVTSTEAQSKDIICPQCGNILPMGTKFCNKCGYKLS